jgi:transcriptional regulator with XRE-family HTH domain
MSHAGVNIRKIRTLKGLSQSELAKQLNINRASIGSYEEGRAEPKLETLLKIANIFSLSVEQLVEAELKMNDLIGFKLDGESAEGQDRSAMSQKIPLFYPQDSLSIEDENLKGYSQHISLPLSHGIQRASFSTADYSMHTMSRGPVPGDLLICEFCNSPAPGVPIVFAHNKSWRFGRLDSLSTKKVSLVFDNRNYSPQEIKLTGNYSFWVIRGIFSTALLF